MKPLLIRIPGIAVQIKHETPEDLYRADGHFCPNPCNCVYRIRRKDETVMGQPELEWTIHTDALRVIAENAPAVLEWLNAQCEEAPTPPPEAVID